MAHLLAFLEIDSPINRPNDFWTILVDFKQHSGHLNLVYISFEIFHDPVGALWGSELVKLGHFQSFPRILRDWHIC